MRVALHDAELRDLRAAHRLRCESDVSTGANMLVEQRAKIHPVKLIAAQDDVIIERPLQEVAHILADRIGRALIPLRTLRCLLRREDVHKAARKIVELVARLDMAVQRHAIELRQHIDRTKPGVQAVADRDIDDPVFAAQRHRGFRSVLRQWKQTRARAAAHDDGEGALRRAGR